MTGKLPLVWLAALVCMPFAAQAGMVKCTLPNGTSTFQDTPCAKEADASRPHVSGMQYVSGSEAGQSGNSPSSGATSSGARTTNVNIYVNQTNNEEVRIVRGPPMHRIYMEPARPVERTSSSNGSVRASQPASRGSAPSHNAAH
ncbi:MAG: hypothetical protein JO002_08695 [Burkholderiaceae bacterium]|nr:hypothetical protein [Burkholderiaceae bacterium]